MTERNTYELASTSYLSKMNSNIHSRNRACYTFLYRTKWSVEQACMALECTLYIQMPFLYSVHFGRSIHCHNTNSLENVNFISSVWTDHWFANLGAGIQKGYFHSFKSEKTFTMDQQWKTIHNRHSEKAFTLDQQWKNIHNGPTVKNHSH